MAERRTSLWVAWWVLAACFLLGFFHRFAPATFAGSLASSFQASAAELGVLASWHFWTYTVAQMPAGMLVDRYGVRWCAAAGAAITALGSGVLATAGTLGVAAVGPVLTGAGLSLIFVGIMKFNADWFPAGRYGVITGVTMLLATSGAVAAGSPTAWLLERFFWRDVFLGAAAVGLAMSLGVAALVRDKTDAEPTPPTEPGTHLLRGLREAAGRRELWPLLIATAGTNGTFYAFAGLWGIPLLTETRGASNTAAATHTTAALVVYGIGALLIGVASDRIGLRKPFIVATSVAAIAGWASLALLPWEQGWQSMLLYLLLGASASQVTVAFAALKEVMPPQVAATGLGVLNAGVFGTSAAIQPLFGVVLDAGGAWGWALALMLGVSALGLAGALRARETRCRQVVHTVSDVPLHGSR